MSYTYCTGDHPNRMYVSVEETLGKKSWVWVVHDIPPVSGKSPTMAQAQREGLKATSERVLAWLDETEKERERMSSSRWEFPMGLGAVVKELRIARGMTQAELMERIGSRGNAGISLIESGKRSPGLATIYSLAEALQVSPLYLMARAYIASLPVGG